LEGARLANEDWTPEELELIVADYFAMLSHEINRRTYVKAHHNEALRRTIDRSKGAVEFKHGNISAVLIELGLPILRGYKPAWNFQNALFDAIERYLLEHPATLTPTVILSGGAAEPMGLFEEAPPLTMAPAVRDKNLERLVRKFDPVERDFRNRALGEAGEALVLHHERSLLEQAGCHDLAKRVRWVSKEDGDGAGYDIRSYEPGGAEKLIEVKTTNGGQRTPFFITRNEKELSDERPDAFRLYRVYDFVPSPRLFTLRPPLEDALLLETETWRAGFGRPPPA
jgi:hypothetical protein